MNKRYRIFFKCNKRDNEFITCIVVYYGFTRKLFFWNHWIGHMIEGLVMDGCISGDAPTKFGDKYHHKYDTEKILDTEEEYLKFKEDLRLTKDNAFIFFTSDKRKYDNKAIRSTK